MAAVYPAGPEPTITTLAWVVFVMFLHAPRRFRALLARGGRTFAGSFAEQDVWLRAELCKIRNPSHPQVLAVLAITISGARNIVSRNNISRYEWVMAIPADRLWSALCPPDSTPSTARSSRNC